MLPALRAAVASPRLLPWLFDRFTPFIVAFLVGLVAVSTQLGLDFDRGLQVMRWEMLRHPATGRLAFIDIDARSLAAYRNWPWPRSRYAAAIAALDRAGARTIAFDVEFSAPSMPGQDAALARAIAASRATVILPTFRQAGSQDGQGIIENLPIPILRDRAQLAAVNIYADHDGLVRSYPYGVTIGAMTRPSVGAMLADGAGRAGSAFPIDASIDPASLPQVSFADLLSGHFDVGMLRDRNVLIGASAIELGDRYPVPGLGVIPGAIVQLLGAETLIQRSTPSNRGASLPLLLVLATVAVAGRGSARRRWGILLASGAATFLLPLASEAARLGTFSVAPALLALLGGAIATAVHGALRSAREARHIDLETNLPNGRSLRDLLAICPEGNAVVLRLANFGDVASLVGREHSAELITRVAERLAHAGDTPVHRLDEGALAWATVTADAEGDIQRIDAAAAMLRAPFEVNGRYIELTYAFGLAPSVDRDAATRAAKAAGHAVARLQRWARYTADMEHEMEWRLSLASELDQAMAAGDVWVAYQPKLDVRTRRITAAEALVRWKHPGRGMIPPDAFIPALEESGRIADLTLHVLRQALADRASWVTQGLDLGVAVNLSALLPSDPQFVGSLEAVLAEHPDALPHLTLEVTESAAMSDPDRAVDALDRLAGLGLSLSIDDYGTGLSTLSYLKRLPAREIKIDKSFVLALENSKGDQAMVRSTIELAHELGFKVVAEGVETEVSLQILASFGCDIVQGWHIGRPMPAADLATLVKNRFAEPSPYATVAAVPTAPDATSSFRLAR